MKQQQYKEEMIKQVQMLAEELGRTPTCNEFNDDPRTVYYGTVKKYFGCWNEFLKYAKLKPSRRSKFSGCF